MSEKRPEDIAEWSALSYYRLVRHIKARRYKRRYLVRSYLRRVKGKKRRVRVNVYAWRTVKVPARDVWSWVVEAPPPLPPKPKIKAPWLNVRDYEYQLETVMSYYGGEITEYEMPIYHTSMEHDSIHTGTLFVWPVRRFPHRVFEMERRFGKAGKKPFTRIRIWFTVRKDDGEEYQVWMRTAAIVLTPFKDLYSKVLELFEKARADQEEYNDAVRRHDPIVKQKSTPEGFTVQELVAWTAYTGIQKAASVKRKK